MAYTYLDHEADVGIQASGASLAEAFAECARAMFGIMADLDTIRLGDSIGVHCEAVDAEALLVAFLNELLFQQEVAGLIFGVCDINRLEEGLEGWHLDGVAWGEPPDPERHELRTEVKAATYSGLSITRRNGHFVIQCLVDV